MLTNKQQEYILKQTTNNKRRFFIMGENYTRKTENYTARQNRQPATATPPNKTVSFTCWRCNKGFELPIEKAKPDHVQCPYCEMTHGQITHSKDA